MNLAALDPYFLCWKFSEILKQEIDRGTLSPESRRHVALARRWLRDLPPPPELRIQAAFALAHLALVVGEEHKHLVNTVRLAMAWLPEEMPERDAEQ
jgi:hypothetical protein